MIKHFAFSLAPWNDLMWIKPNYHLVFRHELFIWRACLKIICPCRILYRLKYFFLTFKLPLCSLNTVVWLIQKEEFLLMCNYNVRFAPAPNLLLVIIHALLCVLRGLTNEDNWGNQLPDWHTPAFMFKLASIISASRLSFSLPVPPSLSEAEFIPSAHRVDSPHLPVAACVCEGEDVVSLQVCAHEGRLLASKI